MTSYIATEKEDIDRQMGADAIEQELRQFKLLRHLNDEELAHRMAKKPSEVRGLRKHFSRGAVRIRETGMDYRIRLLLGQHGIKTLAQLHRKTDEQLRAIPLLGPKRLAQLKATLEKYYHG